MEIGIRYGAGSRPQFGFPNRTHGGLAEDLRINRTVEYAQGETGRTGASDKGAVKIVLVKTLFIWQLASRVECELLRADNFVLQFFLEVLDENSFEVHNPC